MADWVYNSNKQGLETVFFDYEVETLHYLWSKRVEFIGTREICYEVNKKMKISRASVINSLTRMTESGILEVMDSTGKGGHRSLYRVKLNETELKKQIAEKLIANINTQLS